ncbi:MAG: ribonucleotide reductase subunit alpha [Betaproteobacteria bacterium]|nr:ribonucleotide reductase subunit alpha [Betaproteobacteria bacterium]
MTIATFDDLLLAARAQPSAQRLLLVFATAHLPDDATAQQRIDFEAGNGGALVPAMCVDKVADELGSFASIALEATQFHMPWCMVFASTLSGVGDQAPSSQSAQSGLERMVESIKLGALADMIAFDTSGNVVLLD